MLSTKDKRVVEFYKTHNYIDFETANILLVELLERLLQKNTACKDDILHAYLKKMENNFVNLSTSVSDMRENMKSSSQNILNLQTTLTNIPISMTDNITNKLSSFKDSQMKELERIFEINKHLTSEHIDKKMRTEILDTIKNILETTKSDSTILVDNIKLLLDSKMNENLQSHLKQFENSIKEEQQKFILQFERNDSPKTIIETLNSNIQIKCDSLQQTILSQLNNQLNTINETTSSHTETLNKVNNHFDRQKNSTLKGKDSETRMEDGLHKIFLDAKITNTTGQAKSGDFLVERQDKPTIMIENKDYSKIVESKEVTKFIRDIEHLSQHGIFISQNTGICNKQNFQIDMHNGYIVIYIHNLNYEFDKILMAVCAIDHLSLGLKNYCGDSNEIKISSTTLKSINDEYKTWVLRKKEKLNTLKSFYNTMYKQLIEDKFPELSKFLSQEFSSSEETPENFYKCKYCFKPIKAAQGVAPHERKCKLKNKQITENECINIDTIIDTNVEDVSSED